MNTKHLKAIRGKLVPQNPQEGNATDLLKEHNDIPEEEIPFEIPKNWCWCKGNEIFSPMTSRRPKGEDFRYIDIESIDNKIQKIHHPKVLKMETAPSRASRETKIGDIVFSMVRPYLKNIARISEDLEDCIASTGFFVCRPKEFIDSKYCYYLMISSYVVNGLNQFMKGDNSPSINSDDITDFLYPLPTLSEQQRIVSAIEKAFEQIDIIEKNKLNLKTYIKQTKSKVLDLAIHGKLVEQIPQEGNAADLLKAEEVIQDDIPFELPMNWCWCRLTSLCEYGKCKNADPSELQPDSWILDLEDIEKDAGVIKCYKTFSERNSLSTKHFFTKGTVLYSKLRPYLNKVVIAPKDGFCTSEILPLDFKGKYINAFAQKLLMSPYFLSTVNMLTYGVKMPRLGTNEAKQILLPLPPLEEQQRIVERIEQIFEQLDILEKSLGE